MMGLVTLGETMGVFAAQSSGPLHLHQHMALSIAGAESTVAIGVARLGHKSCWIGRVGADEIGGMITKTLAAEGITVDSVVVDDHAPTGLMVRERRLGSVVRVGYHRRGSAGSALTADDIDPGLIRDAAMLHITGITPALSASAAAAVRRAVDLAREAGVAVSMDVNYRSRLWSREQAAATLTPLARDASVVFGSADELALVAEGTLDIPTAAAALLDNGVAVVVAKLGAAGAEAYDNSGRTAVSALAIAVVDVIGAGDAFVAGYLSGALSGADLPARLALGCRVAAFCVASDGDWEGLPRAEELDLLNAVEPTVR